MLEYISCKVALAIMHIDTFNIMSAIDTDLKHWYVHMHVLHMYLEEKTSTTKFTMYIVCILYCMYSTYNLMRIILNFSASPVRCFNARHRASLAQSTLPPPGGPLGRVPPEAMIMGGRVNANPGNPLVIGNQTPFSV